MDQGQCFTNSCPAKSLTKLFKTDFYKPNDVIVPGGFRVSNLFGTRDEAWHDKVIRPVKSLWQMTRALDMEPQIDITLNDWLETLDRKFVLGKCAGRSFDIANWVPYCECQTQ